MKTTIAAVILTYNEEIHIERCIQSLKSLVDEIFVVDSFSEDKTVEIAEKNGAIVSQNTFVNQAVQFNWGLENCNIKSEWILRIDADEYIENPMGLQLKEYFGGVPDAVNGFAIKRKIIFMQQPLMHGGWYPKRTVRIFRNGFGACENRWMDEHIVIKEGRIEDLEIDFVDENLNDLRWWITKHNNYSIRECVDYFLKNSDDSKDQVKPNLFGNTAERKRWLKSKYQRTPLFIRPFVNFLYRYFVLLGFLDSKGGFIWHVLQGFWYRFLVDAKIFELKQRFNNDEHLIVAFLKEKYNINDGE